MEENKKLNDSAKEHLKTKENLEEDMKFFQHNSFFCVECEFMADCVHDFNDYTHSAKDLDNIEYSFFTCKFCDKSFGTMPEV